ncbi:MAG: sensor histidine kinase [Candidatus Kariarchaeaceae archaeon]
MDYKKMIPITVIIPALYLLSQENYLLAHTIVEFSSIIIAFGIFLVAWNSREYTDHQMFVFLGIGYIFVGTLDFVHTLAYKGMGVFSFDDPNYPTQLWITARLVQAITFFISFFFLTRRPNPLRIFAIYLLVTSVLIYLIFEGYYPDCFIEDSGLTTFKIVCEYVICLIIAVTLYIFYTKKDQFDKDTYYYISIALVSSILAELSFTLYTDVYGIANVVGHLFKAVSFYFIYLAIVDKELTKQYFMMFRSIKNEQMQNEILRHDLSNNLAVISGYLILFEETSEPSMLEKAKTLVESGSALIGRMRKLSGSTKDYLKSYNLRSVIEEIIVNLSQGITLNVEGNCRIEGDESIYSLFTNLIHNAKRHGKASNIDVRITNLKPGCEVRISDDGVGIPDEVKPKIFHQGFKYGETGGTGIGLYIVNMLVERYNGKISVEDNIPKGTTFVIEFNTS